MSLLLKKVILYSTATFTGSCFITYTYKNITTNHHKKYEKSNYEHLSSSYICIPEDIDLDFDEFEFVDTSWTFWRKYSTPLYWKLLMLCKSKALRVRHNAIESLSKLTNLEKWQYIQVAQACDVNTAIGLARSFKTNKYFFLPPPFKDLNEGNLQNELYVFLSSIQFSDDDCIHILFKQVEKSAKNLLKKEYNVDLEEGDPLVIYHSQRKKTRVFLYDKLCLETMLACSAKSYYRDLMTEKQIFKLLLKLLESHKQDIEIQSLIAQILSNFAIDEKSRESFHITGWIGILSEWKKSPYVAINLPATKALANLDKDDLPHPVYADGIYVLNPASRISEKELSADVIFIHGIRGGAFFTWRQCDSLKPVAKSSSNDREKSTVINPEQYTFCWPKDWLAVDMPSVRIISIDYKTYFKSWSSLSPEGDAEDFINKTAKELTQKLLVADVGKRPIIWICHSLGGLIVKDVLVESFENMDEKVSCLAKSTAGIVFFSVPHKGSKVANRIQTAKHILNAPRYIEDLREGSEILLSLHEKFINLASKHNVPVLSFAETKKTKGLILVPDYSANPGIGEFQLLEKDHLSTCKPLSSKSSEYVKLLDFLKVNISKKNVESVEYLQITDEIMKTMLFIP